MSGWQQWLHVLQNPNFYSRRTFFSSSAPTIVCQLPCGTRPLARWIKRPHVGRRQQVSPQISQSTPTAAAKPANFSRALQNSRPNIFATLCCLYPPERSPHSWGDVPRPAIRAGTKCDSIRSFSHSLPPPPPVASLSRPRFSPFSSLFILLRWMDVGTPSHTSTVLRTNNFLKLVDFEFIQEKSPKVIFTELLVPRSIYFSFFASSGLLFFFRFFFFFSLFSFSFLEPRSFGSLCKLYRLNFF